MGLTSILIVAAVLLILLAGWLVWLFKQPLPELTMTDAEWEFMYPGYADWADSHPYSTWRIVSKETDGLYHLKFETKGARRRFRDGWLSQIQAQMTRQSLSGTVRNQG